MLIPDVIPKYEPDLRVGIILPEDKQKEVNFFIHGKARILTDGQYLEADALSIGMQAEGNELAFMYRGLKIHGETFSVILGEENDHAEVWPVVAGRGFHWHKPIAVKLVSKLEFSLVNGYILLVNELPMEQYLASVATSEMSAACPDAMIEAQTIVARSWMLANVEKKHVNLGFDVCNDDCCQRFQGITHMTDHSLQATEKTRGIVLMFDGKICDARYSKSCGGVMEKFENLWEGDGLPYMQNLVDAKNISKPDLTNEDEFRQWIHSRPEVFCSDHIVPQNKLNQYLGSVDEAGRYFRWTIDISQSALTIHINQKLGIQAEHIRSLKPLSRGGSGRMLELNIDYMTRDGALMSVIIQKDYRIRELLHPSFLYSSACLIEATELQDGIPLSFRYTGGGWGHGAGLCQIGALGMSLNGYAVEEILSHYYPGAVLTTLY